MRFKTLLKVKISFSMFFILSAYSESGKCLSVKGEYGKFRVVCGTVHKIASEYAEKIYAYMERILRDTKLRKSWLIMVRPENFFRSLLSIQDGLD